MTELSRAAEAVRCSFVPSAAMSNAMAVFPMANQPTQAVEAVRHTIALSGAGANGIAKLFDATLYRARMDLKPKGRWANSLVRVDYPPPENIDPVGTRPDRTTDAVVRAAMRGCFRMLTNGC